MSEFVATSKNINARVKNVINMLSSRRLSFEQFRHFIYAMNNEWLNEMTTILGTDNDPENIYNAIHKLGIVNENETDIESEAA